MSRVTTPNASAIKMKSRIGKYLVKYSRRRSKPLIVSVSQRVDQQRRVQILVLGSVDSKRTKDLSISVPKALDAEWGTHEGVASLWLPLGAGLRRDRHA